MHTASRAAPPVDWDTPLKRKVGKARLSNIDVWYDFDWVTLFYHDRATFPYGQSLTTAIREHGPPDKIPCLLLTEKDDAQEGVLDTDTHYVCVIRVKEYLLKASSDPAMAYFAIATQVPLDLLFDFHLDEAAILRWIGRKPSRLVDLLQLVVNVMGNDEGEPAAVRDHDVASTMEALGRILPQLLDAGGIDELRRIADLLAEKRAGRIVIADALATRMADRIEDARMHLDEYRKLLDKSDTNETTFQQFITDHPRLLGLEYVRVHPKAKTPRGEIDFLAERYDGYHDLLELKAPEDPIIKCDDDDSETPGSASQYSLGSALANALAQVQVYRRQLTRSAEAMDEDYGVSHTRHPRATIIVGRQDRLSDAGKRILRELNRSLYRIEVMPYDLLARRAEVQLNNVETLLSWDR